MADRGYTISLTGGSGLDRATIFQQEGSWYYCLRQADPHGEEFVGEPVGPFPTSEEAERRAQEDFIPPAEGYDVMTPRRR